MAFIFSLSEKYSFKHFTIKSDVSNIQIWNIISILLFKTTIMFFNFHLTDVIIIKIIYISLLYFCPSKAVP